MAIITQMNAVLFTYDNSWAAVIILFTAVYQPGSKQQPRLRTQLASSDNRYKTPFVSQEYISQY